MDALRLVLTARIFSPTACALSLITLQSADEDLALMRRQSADRQARMTCRSVVARLSASAIASVDNVETFSPAPSLCTRLAQKNWSPNHGLMIVGKPAIRM